MLLQLFFEVDQCVAEAAVLEVVLVVAGAVVMPLLVGVPVAIVLLRLWVSWNQMLLYKMLASFEKRFLTR